MKNFLPANLKYLGTNYQNNQFLKQSCKLVTVIAILLFSFKPAANAQRLFLDSMGTAGTATYTQSNTPNSHVPSNYTFIGTSSGVAPQDGQYAITNNTNLLNNAGQGATPYSYAGQEYGWLTNVKNHTTTTGNGYYLLINADAAHVFYQTTLSVLQYHVLTVNFYALNIINPADPTNGNNGGNVTFLKPLLSIVVRDAVTGAVIGESTAITTLAQNNTWTLITAPVNTGASTNVIVQLLDTQNSGVGNDFALDDVSVDQTNCAPPSTPVLGTITQPSCTTGTGSVALSGLPSGSWTITNALSTPADTLTGSGTSATLTGLLPGSYRFEVTNSLTCSALTPTTPTVVLNSPTAPAAPTESVTTAATCSVGASVKATGTGTITGFLLDGTISKAGTPTVTFTGVAAGAHTLQAVNNSCVSTVINFTVTAGTSPNAPTFTTTTAATCGTPTATIKATATGTITGYSLDGGTPQTSSTFTGVAVGTHTLQSVNGTCYSSNTPVNISLPASPAAPTFVVSLQPTCATGGTVVVTFTAGYRLSLDGSTSYTTTSPHTYSGLDGSVTHSLTVTNPTTLCATSVNIPFNSLTPPAQPTLAYTQPACGSTTTSTNVTATVSGVGVTMKLDGTGTAYSSPHIFANVTAGSHYITAISGTYCTTVVNFNVNGLTYTWTGSDGTDPNDDANWSGGSAPPFDGSASINIPNVANGNYPFLTSDISIFNLTMGTSSTKPANFYLNGFTLNVGCNIYNTYSGGTLSYNANLNSTLNWDGNTSQSYTGNTTAGTAPLANMTVANTGAAGTANTVTIAGGPVDIYNTLSLSQGNLTVNASPALLTLKSSANLTATVSQLPPSGSAIKGNVNVERYLTGNNSVNYRGYRLLSSPVYVNTANSLNYFSFKYINQGVGTNLGAFTGGPSTYTGVSPFVGSFSISNPFPTIYIYDESLQSSNATYTSGKNIGIVAIDQTTGMSDVKILQGTTVNSANIPVGNGYIFYFVGPNGTTAGAIPKTAAQNATMTATGTLNQGAISVHLWKTPSLTTLSYTLGTGTGVIGGTAIPGINMVGNPYASTIDLGQVYSDNNPGNSSTSSISSIFYELQEPNMTYIAYDVNGAQTSSTNAGPYIVSGQGFLVRANAPNASLTFQEDQKSSSQPTTSTTPLLLLAAKPKSLSLAPTKNSANAGLHLQLSKDTIINTQTGIYFSDAYSDTYNQLEDAIDLDGISPQVYLSSFSTDGKRLGINSMGDYIKGKHVQLYVKASTTGTYTLGLADIKNIDTIFNVYLVDKLLKDSVDLRKFKTYSFTITTTDTTTFGANRFELAIDVSALPDYKLLSFTGQSVSTGAQLSWKTINESNYTGFVLQKQLANNTFTTLDSLQSDGSGTYSYIDNHPSKGVNTYRLKQYGVTGAITYSALVYVDYDASSLFGVYPNPTKGPININVNLKSNSYNLSIYNSMGGLVRRLPLTGSNWTQDISSYTTGTYIMELSDTKGNFVGKTKVVKVQ